jgi:hypothetical protein
VTPTPPPQPKRRVPKAQYQPWTPAELDALCNVTPDDLAAAQSAPILTPKLRAMLAAPADDAETNK